MDRLGASKLRITSQLAERRGNHGIVTAVVNAEIRGDRIFQNPDLRKIIDTIPPEDRTAS
jgi:hypothetical protein